MSYDALDMLRNVAKFKEFPPSAGLHVVENEALAWISLIAANDAGWEQTAVLPDVVEGDVGHRDQGLGRATSNWVSHASITRAIGFLLLLRSDIDSPPEWHVNLNVIVDDVADFTT